MVIGAFPAAKLGILAIKQISKPIANVIKSHAKSSPVFRKYICMPPAQFYNFVEVKTKMWVLNLGRPVSVPPLNEAMAIELGANLLGEIIIFIIGAGLLVIEYSRQATKETKKMDSMREEKLELVNTLAELSFKIERQDAQILEMTRALGVLESRRLFNWSKEPIAVYKPFDPTTPDQSPITGKTYDGDYDPKAGILYSALNYLETQIFANRPKDSQQQAMTRIEAATEELQTAIAEATQEALIESHSEKQQPARTNTHKDNN